MRDFVPSYIADLKPYVPGKPVDELERELGIRGAIKLASNENPLGPSPMALEAIRRAAQAAHVYPDGGAFRLRRSIAAKYGIPMDEIIVGNGSNEILTIATRTFSVAGDHAALPDYSFIAYRLIASGHGLAWTSAPTGADFASDVGALISACGPQTRLVFLANPNNPTGTYTRRADLERLLDEIPPEAVVLIDEAYHEYVEARDYASALSLRDRRERLIVTRTFSKAYGLGGMRVGWAASTPEMIGLMNRLREPFNCNLLAQAAADAALADEPFLADSVRVNADGRAVLERGLAALKDRGVHWTRSQTNFLLVHLPSDGRAVYEAMLRAGVIVRPMAGYGLERSLRISIGTPAQCERCVEALGAALSALGVKGGAL